MSSPRGAAAKVTSKSKGPPKTAHKSAAKMGVKDHAKDRAKSRAKARTKPPARPPVTPPAQPAATTASAQATRLAADIERALADGRIDTLSPQALQALMAAACKAFAAQVEAGNPVAALAQRTTVTPTEVMVTASGLLRAANLAVFELGMWQSWTGR
jgi:phage I-like protein